jgi:hypothetical protein
MKGEISLPMSCGISDTAGRLLDPVSRRGLMTNTLLVIHALKPDLIFKPQATI